MFLKIIRAVNPVEDDCFDALVHVSVYKTGKSKRSHLAFWREQKLKPDRPSQKKPSLRDKSISFFFRNDKHDLEQLVLCLALKGLTSIKVNVCAGMHKKA